MWRGAILLVLVLASTVSGAAAQPTTSGGWTLTPAGEQIAVGDRPLSLAPSPDGQILVVGNNGQGTQSLMVIDRASGEVVQTISYEQPEALFIGLQFSPDGSHVYASAGGNNKVRTYDVVDHRLIERVAIPLDTERGGKKVNLYPTGLAVTPDGATVYVANNLDDSVSVIDVANGAATQIIRVGHNPYGVIAAADGRHVYVSNWGGRTVSVIDTASRAAIATIDVETHPSAMALSADRNELYVANTDSDSVSIIDVATNVVARSISLAPYDDAAQGSSPNALAVSGDRLYVANAGNNDVAVVQLGATDTVLGLIPTAWYPTAVAVSPAGDMLYVANAKGLGTGPNPGGPDPTAPGPVANDQFVGTMAVGTLSSIPVPDAATLEADTQQVIANNGFDERAQVRQAAPIRERVIPRRPGDPSPITHVIYVVRENRTYDQVLGSLGKGNGDPSLTLFDDASAPNTRELARRFVTLDNFFADAEVSADGWNWSTAAEANTYVQKTWPANYSSRNRPYDFEGGNLASAPGPIPEQGYLWDRLGSAGVTYRNYGFWIFAGGVATTAPDLAANTDLAFAGYDLNIQDQARVDEWQNEFSGYVERGDLPTVELVRLPNDHTAGTRPKSPTPRAYMADNDLAVGRLVETVSRSPYWSSTAILVVEDDGQNGPDHVDAHRTVALVVSPYSQTGAVDSTYYSTSSLLRTLELIVGIGPMTQFDAAATPMLASFTDRPDPRPYRAIIPDQPLDELNARDAPMAAESSAMDFSAEDRAPEVALNAAIWQSVRGAGAAMPQPRTSFHAPPARD